ncbi:hypothetical protein FNX48_026230, partial [Streptomyces sp. IF17]|nr:hypothetical protein [Streptomyces alkaliphilus]
SKNCSSSRRTCTTSPCLAKSRTATTTASCSRLCWQGKKQVDDIMLNTREWYDQNRIVLHAGDPVVAIDRPRRTLRSRDGVEMRYDRLLIATGSRPFILPVPGHLLPGVIAFRDIQDVETMLEAARNHRHAVVIGGGLLGLEAANGLM